MRKTEKLYYQDNFLKACTATVLGKNGKGILTDRTVAFAEGGGQVGDRGSLSFNDKTIAFHDTIKGLGKPLVVPDFPVIQIETPVLHIVDEEQLKEIEVGEELTITIDVQHRIKTTMHHTGIHLALMAALDVRPDMTKFIKGCKIDESSARLDFSSFERFSAEDMKAIDAKIQSLIEQHLAIFSKKHGDHEEAWDWFCGDFTIPCGGTHLQHTGQLGKYQVRRKTKGKSTERLIIEVENCLLEESLFHV